MDANNTDSKETMGATGNDGKDQTEVITIDETLSQQILSTLNRLKDPLNDVANLMNDNADSKSTRIILPTPPEQKSQTMAASQEERTEYPSEMDNNNIPELTVPKPTWETLQQLVVQNTHAIQMLIQLLTNSQKPKLLPPEQYTKNGSISLGTFLTKFEKYATSMYPGSSSEMGAFLGRYLEGSVLEIYKSIKSTTDNYQEIKQRLLMWEHDEDSKEKGQQDLEFMEAIMSAEETVHMFAMRIIRLAKRCFPNVEVTQVPMVLNKFIAGLTPTLNKEVKRAMLMQEATLGVQLSWDRVVAVADKSASLCQTTDRQHGVFTKEPITLPHFQGMPLPDAKEKELIDLCPVVSNNIPPNYILGQSGVIPPMSYPYPTMPINNHLQIPQQQLPFYQPQYLSNSTQQSMPQNYANASSNVFTAMPTNNVNKGQYYSKNSYDPTKKKGYASNSPSYGNQNLQNPNANCRFCHKKGHLMGQCLLRPLCTWCSKRGHTFDQCYTAKGICIKCQEHGHEPKNCPLKTMPTDEIVICPGCQGPHYGKDCLSTNGLPPNASQVIISQGNS